MKVKRQKNCRKIVNFYNHNFNFKPPFQILVDGTFCQSALKNKINIKDQLPKYLENEILLYTTSCVLHELKSLGKQVYGAFHIAKQFKLKKCDHIDSPILPNKCLITMVKKRNPSHYWLASQDTEITDKLKLYASVPLLYISYNAINLSKPNKESKELAGRKIIDSIRPVKGDIEDTCTENIPSSYLQITERHIAKRKKRAKGPNPLACLKKK